jgi:hypothetical protein
VVGAQVDFAGQRPPGRRGGRHDGGQLREDDDKEQDGSGGVPGHGAAVRRSAMKPAAKQRFDVCLTRSGV